MCAKRTPVLLFDASAFRRAACSLPYARRHARTRVLTAGRTGRLAAAVKDDAKQSATCVPRHAAPKRKPVSNIHKHIMPAGVTASASHIALHARTAWHTASREHAQTQAGHTEQSHKALIAYAIMQMGCIQRADSVRQQSLRVNRARRTHARRFSDHGGAAEGAKVIAQVSAPRAVRGWMPAAVGSTCKPRRCHARLASPTGLLLPSRPLKWKID